MYIDLHCDTITTLNHKKASLYENDLMVSLKKGKALDKWLQTYAIFIPDNYRGQPAWDYYEDNLRYFRQQMEEHKEHVLQIQKFSDIAREGIRYVNRQKGSGTRILTDYLCKQENLNTDVIYGYDREELTHTSVAAQIVSGSADAGMGIYSAAKLYDLDFIPICIEEYDLIIPDHAWDTPQVQQLIATLKSDAFREKIRSLGGYTVENSGEIIPLD